MLTEQQRLERKKGIGGSDAAAVIGWSRWKTPYDVWQEKTGQVEVQQNEAMRLGIELEPYVRELYEHETGEKVAVPDKILFHHKHPFILANPDGIIESKNLGVEFKTTQDINLLNLNDLTDNKDWLCQVAHYAEILKVSHFHVFVMHRETKETRLYQYQACDSFQTALIEKEVNFWEKYVVKNNAPPVRTLNDVRKKFSLCEKMQAIADSETLQKINRYVEIHHIKNHLKEEEDALKMDIFLEMATANELIDESGIRLATWNEAPNNRFNTTAFKKDHPDLYEKYFVKDTIRRFLPNYSRSI